MYQKGHRTYRVRSYLRFQATPRGVWNVSPQVRGDSCICEYFWDRSEFPIPPGEGQIANIKWALKSFSLRSQEARGSQLCLVQCPLSAHARCLLPEMLTASRCSGGGDANDPGAPRDYVCEKWSPSRGSKEHQNEYRIQASARSSWYCCESSLFLSGMWMHRLWC